MSEFLKELESYPDLEGSIIRATKIHKVLKAMLKLPSIPLDEEFSFKKRADELLQAWNDILLSDPNSNAGDKNEKDSKPEAGAASTNGESKETEKQAKKAEAGEAAAPEEETSKNKIGTKIEGEKEADKPAEEAKDDSPAGEYKPSAVDTIDEAAA